MTTNISEKGLETLIMLHMTGADGLGDPRRSGVQRRPHAAAFPHQHAVEEAEEGGKRRLDPNHGNQHDERRTLDSSLSV